MGTRRFLYLDLDSFFCCCEILRDRSLRTVPFAVGGSPTQRGVVSSASYPARQYGVHSAMPMSQAVRICPSLRVVPSHFDDYQQRSREVMEYLHTLTDAVEQRSVDEAVLEVTDLPQDSDTLAHAVQSTIRQRFRLPCSLGIASAIRGGTPPPPARDSDASDASQPRSVATLESSRGRSILRSIARWLKRLAVMNECATLHHKQLAGYLAPPQTQEA